MRHTAPHRLLALAACVGALALRAPAQAQSSAGLLPGTVAGTRVTPGTASWIGAQPAGVSTGADGIRELLIRQNQSRATLNWQQFNIDRNERVRFDQQGNRNWAALNWIHDSKPSEIAGRLVADGAVYLINANGIVFKPGSQVDAASFIASTLSIRNDAFVKGLTAMASGQAAFEFDPAVGSPAARIELQSGVVRRLDGTAVTGPDGKELVQAASIQSASGGRVFLLGTREVVNNGLVRSPDGQVILAAGSKVYLFAPRADDSASFRGLFVEVDAGSEARNLGSILNTGTIETAQGNTTLAAMAIRHAGRISADTAATGNGSVYLYARSNPRFQLGSTSRPNPTASGTVVLEPGSVIEAMPRTRVDAEGKPEQVLDSQAVYPSEVRLAGQSIHLQGGNTGARITAPGGLVSAVANENFDNTPTAAVRPVGDGRIVVDGGVLIDVAGVRDVSVPVTRNIIDVQIGGENVADNPTLRTGTLASQTVKVDVRTGSPLFSQATLDAVAGQQIRRTVEERMAAGGTVSLSSTGEAVVNPGARIGLAGGSVVFTPGFLQTSRLSDGSRTVDVGAATPDRNWTLANSYTETDERWGVTRTFSLGSVATRDPGYLQGFNAGRLELVAPWVSLGGTVDGSTVSGSRQRTSPPLGGMVTFGQREAFLSAQPDFQIRSPMLLGQSPGAMPPAAFSIDGDRQERFGTESSANAQAIDVSSLSASGISRLEVFSNNSVIIPAGSPLSLPAGGRVTAVGSSLEVAASVSVPGARSETVVRRNDQDVRSAGIDLSATPIGSDTPSASSGAMTVRGARIDASGQWLVQSTAATSGGNAPYLLDAGSVRLQGYNQFSVDSSSGIDISAGARLGPNNVLASGRAGSLQMGLTSREPASIGVSRVADFAAPVRAYGFGTGASLRASAIDILVSDVRPDAFGGLWLSAGRLASEGWSSVDLTGVSSARVADDTSIRLVPSSLVFKPGTSAVTSAATLQAQTTPTQQPEYLLKPSSFALRTSSTLEGTTEIGARSQVEVAPGGSIALDAGYRARLAGALRAPGGAVSLTLDNGSNYLGFRGTQGIHVQSGARLDVSGIDTTIPLPGGQRGGSVLAAGSVSINAPSGYLVMEPGSRVDARGAVGQVDGNVSDVNTRPVTQSLASAGGKVSLISGNGGVIAASIDVAAGGASAASGSVVIGQSREVAQGAIDNTIGPRPIRLERLNIVDDAKAMPGALAVGADVDAALNAGAAPGNEVFETRVARSTLERLDANVLALQARDQLTFGADTRLSARRQVTIDAPAIQGDGQATLSIRAPYVELGWTRRNTAALPVGVTQGTRLGEARLDVASTLALDLVGSLVLQGIGNTTLETAGDLRLRGIFTNAADGSVPPYAVGRLDASGRVDLIASQIFPTTGSSYSIALAGPQSTLTTARTTAESPPVPLSALGRMQLSADRIELQGVQRAPLGTIEIDARESVVAGSTAEISVSAANTLVPYGVTQDRRQIIYPFDGGSTGRALTGFDSEVRISGASIDLKQGSLVDASGGGDVLASAFIAGSGGSADVLRRPNLFAVVPGYSAAMPFDFQMRAEIPTLGGSALGALSAFRGALPAGVTTNTRPTLSVGDRIYLSAGSGLPQGEYTLMPARYALLPGAYAVALTDSVSFSAPRPTTLADGSSLIAAQRFAASSNERDARWTAVNVLSGTQIRRYAEFITDLGSRDLGAKADATGSIRAPQDAGTVAIDARGTSVRLDAAIRLNPGQTIALAEGGTALSSEGTTTGRRGAFELSSDGASLVIGGATAGGSSGATINLDAARLSGLNAGRLLIGARRSQSGDDTLITPTAARVTVEAGSTIQAEDVVLAATDRIALGRDARLTAPDSGVSAAQYQLPATGAVISVSGGTPTFTRSGNASGSAQIELAAGSAIQARSVMLDAPGGIAQDPSVRLLARNLDVSTRRLVLGDGPVAGNPSGLTRLSASQLQSFASGERMMLAASETLYLTEGLQLGTAAFGAIELRTPALSWADPARAGVASVTAQSIILSGGPDLASSQPSTTTGQGELRLDATTGALPDSGQLLSQSGGRALSGFARVDATARSAWILSGEGATRTAGDLTVRTPQVLTAAGATQSVTANQLTLTSLASATGVVAPQAQPGGRLNLGAQTMTVDTLVRLPSGRLSISSTGADTTRQSLILGGSARLDVGSASMNLFDQTFSATAGTVTLSAQLGSILAQPGSRMDASGRTDVAGGQLVVSAPRATVSLQGVIAASGPLGQGGQIEVDARTVDRPEQLTASLRSGGFDAAVNLRQRTGDLRIGADAAASTPVIAAREIRLTADSGSVRLEGGRLDASGPSGGEVELNAGARVVLAAGTSIIAQGSSQEGGRVQLNGRSGVLARGARIDVDGVTQDGEIELRFDRTAVGAANLQADAGSLTGAKAIYLTGVKSYAQTVSANNANVTTATLTTPFSEAQAYANNAAQVLSLTGLTGQAAARVRPEIELTATGATNSASLTVNNALDFSTRRYTTVTPNDTAGVLTLRAAGDLVLNGASTTPGTAVTAVLTDGFVAGTAFNGAAATSTALGASFDTQAKDTWSFKLVAGADLTAADPLAVRSTSDPLLGAALGNLRLLNNRIIRTGTGSIDVAAARDIRLGTSSATTTALVTGTTGGRASIMTAGRRAADVPNFVDPQSLYDPDDSPADPRVNFTEGGGSITLTAGGSIASTIQDPLASSWLFRQGRADANGLALDSRSPAWWPRFDFFRQSVGALGGGDIVIRAKGNIENVSASIGTSGRLVLTGNPLLDQAVINGGGDLTVRAEGSIRSGSFAVMQGSARLVAGETLERAATAPYATIAGLGDAALQVEARRNLQFDQVYNPTLSEQRATNAKVLFAENRSYFSTYTDRSAVALTSIGGKATLQESGVVLRTATVTGETAASIDVNDLGRITSLRPATLAVTSLAGDVEIIGKPGTLATDLPASANVILAPAARGGITLGAAGSITGVGSLVSLDTDPLTSFSLSRPGTMAGTSIVTHAGVSIDSEVSAGRLNPTSTARPLAHADRLVRVNDNDPSRVYAVQDITTLPTSLESESAAAAASRLRFVFAEPAQVRAGRDITDVSLTVQNLRDGDVSLVSAGRDVNNRTQLAINEALALSNSGVVLNGPGRLEVLAGRDISMGTSVGIVSRGNLDNAALPDVGGSVTLVAGLPEGPAYGAFLGRYVDPSNAVDRPRDYTELLVAFVNSKSPNPPQSPVSAEAAWQAFNALPETERNAFARAVFFTELRSASRAASTPQIDGKANPGYGNFKAAYDAMSTLFPKDGGGNIDLVFSQVKTERGGKLEFLVPGVVCRGDWTVCQATDASAMVGNLRVGLANPPDNLSTLKKASQLGIFTLGEGSIDIALGSNAAVNRSRVLTAGGGGITMFSAQGDIDAGRGSRTATSAPPPLVRVDKDGNVVVELPGVVEGSGIGVLVTKSGTAPGDVDLFAPKGFIDAGEAGIRSAGNLTLFATEVRNSANISFSGSATGVPTTTAAPNLSLATASNTTAAATASEAQSATDRDGRGESRTQNRSRLLVLEFLGFAEDGEESYRKRRSSK